MSEQNSLPTVVATFMDGATGQWSGPSNLWFKPGDTPKGCTMKATVTRQGRGRFLAMDYTWDFKGQPQDGHLVLCGDSKGQWTAMWYDSFHQSGAFLTCTGSLGTPVSVKGEYEVPGHPNWGWRMGLEFRGDSLVLAMWNVTPDGEEALAVESVMTRVS